MCKSVRQEKLPLLQYLLTRVNSIRLHFQIKISKALLIDTIRCRLTMQGAISRKFGSTAVDYIIYAGILPLPKETYRYIFILLSHGMIDAPNENIQLNQNNLGSTKSTPHIGWCPASCGTRETGRL